MTDDELEGALFALSLEEPPADLRARILAATVDRPRLTFRAWEVWLVGTLLACMVWLTFLIATSVPDFGGAISGAISAAINACTERLSLGVLTWTALGVSFVVWISQLSLPVSRPEAANR